MSSEEEYRAHAGASSFLDAIEQEMRYHIKLQKGLSSYLKVTDLRRDLWREMSDFLSHNLMLRAERKEFDLWTHVAAWEKKMRARYCDNEIKSERAERYINRIVRDIVQALENDACKDLQMEAQLRARILTDAFHFVLFTLQNMYVGEQTMILYANSGRVGDVLNE